VAWHAPWAQRFASVPGAAGFQIVLQGSCWLLLPDADPVPLAAGDVVFRPHGRGHTLADNPATPPAPACDPSDPQALQRYATGTVGTPAGAGIPATVTLCGAYELDPARAHPLRVEVGLVADDTAAHPADALRVELRGELQQVERRESRVAAALEEDVAAPDRALELALAEDVGLEPEARPEREQGCVRDGELLIRRRDEGQARMPGVHRLTRDEVDGEGSRTRLRHVGNRQRSRETP